MQQYPIAAPASGTAAEIRADELAFIRAALKEGNSAAPFKWLAERGKGQQLVRQQYHGRYPLELLQNANDAAVRGGAWRAARFMVTEEALLVANTGAGFDGGDVKSLCGFGNSSKDPRKSIGYKGIGFKSVYEISDCPQVFSPPERFGFDTDRVRALLEYEFSDYGLSFHDVPIPSYAFPFDLSTGDAGADQDLVEECLASGFVTVVRLPFRSNVDREQVAGDLRRAMRPETLLLLEGIDDLELRGTGSDFHAHAQVQHRGDYEEVALKTGSDTSLWSVHRQSHTVDQALVETLDGAWRDVTTVSTVIAVMVDSDGRPIAGPGRPLHVYFPLDDSARTTAVLHADFYLDIDRRRITDTPEARSYNDWLTTKLAEHAAQVCQELAQRFPSDYGPLKAFVPAQHAEGRRGDKFRKELNKALKQRSVVPCWDGTLRLPAESMRLPGTATSEPVDVTAILDLKRTQCALPAEKEDGVLTWLSDHNQTQISYERLLQFLRKPGDADLPAYYGALVQWSNECEQNGSLTRQAFHGELKRVPWIRTIRGNWALPGSVYFEASIGLNFQSAEGESFEFVHTPENGDLSDLMRVTGVRQFTARQLIEKYVLSQLSDRQVSQETYDAALSVLRKYFDTHPAATADRSLLGKVLLPASNIAKTKASFGRANTLYFTSAWPDGRMIEEVYGDFGQPEFLAITAPEAAEEINKDSRFYRWLGVEYRPRIHHTYLGERDPVSSEIPYSPEPLNLPGSQEDEWRRIHSQQIDNCGQYHPRSQQIHGAYWIDRLTSIIGGDDPGKLEVFLRLLLNHWKIYGPLMQLRVRCSATSHTGDSDREVPSIIAHFLRNQVWLPIRRDANVTFHSPKSVWLHADQMPPDRTHLPVVGPDLKKKFADELVSLGVIRDPGIGDYVTVLNTLKECHQEGSKDSASILNTAKWAMQRINALMVNGDDSEDSGVDSVPLLARFRNRYCFVDRPYVCRDSDQAKVWSKDVAIFAGSSNLNAVISRRNLPRLDTNISTVLTPDGYEKRLSAELTERFRPKLAHVAALLCSKHPTLEHRILGRLQGLRFYVCTSINVEYHWGEQIRPGTSRVAHVIEPGPTGESSPVLWYSAQEGSRFKVFNIADAIARHLKLPSDATSDIGMMLGEDEEQKEELLEFKKADIGKVEQLKRVLKLGEDDFDSTVDLDWRTQDLSLQLSDNTNCDSELANNPQIGPPMDLVSGSDLDDEDAGNLAEIQTVDLETSDRLATSRKQRTIAPTTGSALRRDFGARHRVGEANGSKGEELAFKQEQKRVQALGYDADRHVIWQSKLNQQSNYDIKSVDNCGNTIYIEVKSTDSDESNSEVFMSRAEIEMAQEFRQYYYIYRVYNVNARAKMIIYPDPWGFYVTGRARLETSEVKLYLPSIEVPNDR